MKNVIFTASNLNTSSSFNNVYTSKFPSGSVAFKDESVSLCELTIYNSFYNITSSSTGSRYNNNTFQYIWVDGSVNSVVIPDGNYEYSGINSYLISVLTNNNHYLIDSNGDNVYYLDISASTTQYGVILSCYAVPSSLPSGWSLPSGATWSLLGSAQTPQFSILSSNNFYKIIGFTAGNYPSTPQTSDYNVISNLTPEINPSPVIFLNCSIADNKCSIPQTFIYSFTTGNSSFGQSLTIRPPAYLWTPITSGQYKNIEISFTNADGYPIYVNDTNLVVILAIESDSRLKY